MSLTLQTLRYYPKAHIRQGADRSAADALRILLTSREPSDGEERNQDNEDNPNINSHQSSPAARVRRPQTHRETKKAPGVPGLQGDVLTSRDQGALDAPILFQSCTAQNCYLAMAAMRPDPPRACFCRRAGVSPTEMERVMTEKRIAKRGP